MSHGCRAFLAVVSLTAGWVVLFPRAVSAHDFDSLLESQRRFAISTLLENMAPDFQARGTVIASPSRQAPNYFMHWVRDAALVMDVGVTLLSESKDIVGAQLLAKQIRDYAYFSRFNQVTPNASGGLGEPLFQPNGMPIFDGWGRPQNDGPALRALTLMRFADYLLRNGVGAGAEEWIRRVLYDGKIPTESVIKADLEYTAHAGKLSYDLWEEVYGQHFYTLMVQRRALLEGARFATRMGDTNAAPFYQKRGTLLTHLIREHWKKGYSHIAATLNIKEGIPYKLSNLDVAVILGVLHGHAGDGFFGPTHSGVLATAQRLRAVFRELYPINHGCGLGVLFGRYEEDEWNGVSRGGRGNPWILATNAMAELDYRVRNEILKRGYIQINAINAPFFADAARGLEGVLGTHPKLVAGQKEFEALLTALKLRADSTMLRTFIDENGRPIFPEQIDRSSPNLLPVGAHSLTWSCASLITAHHFR